LDDGRPAAGEGGDRGISEKALKPSYSSPAAGARQKMGRDSSLHAAPRRLARPARRPTRLATLTATEPQGCWSPYSPWRDVLHSACRAALEFCSQAALRRLRGECLERWGNRSRCDRQSHARRPRREELEGSQRVRTPGPPRAQELLSPRSRPTGWNLAGKGEWPARCSRQGRIAGRAPENRFRFSGRLGPVGKNHRKASRLQVRAARSQRPPPPVPGSSRSRSQSAPTHESSIWGQF